MYIHHPKSEYKLPTDSCYERITLLYTHDGILYTYSVDIITTHYILEISPGQYFLARQFCFAIRPDIKKKKF